MDAVAYLRDFIRAKHADTAKRLMSRAMALDVIFLRFGANAVAVAAPTHPFHVGPGKGDRKDGDAEQSPVGIGAEVAWREAVDGGEPDGRTRSEDPVDLA